MRNLPIPYLTSDQHNVNITFLLDYEAKNEACLLDDSFTSGWLARNWWVLPEDGKPAYGLLMEKYGEAEVPVSIAGNCTYKNMPLSTFIEDFILNPTSPETGYVKDWHFQSFSQFPEEQTYHLPAFLATDWINNEKWSSNSAENPFGGDYRFLYLGTAGSWCVRFVIERGAVYGCRYQYRLRTKFHSDVLNSFSWSANIFGRKLWYLLRPGAERHFATTEPHGATSTCYVEDVRTRREVWAEAGMMEFIQEPGEIVFVPSGWYHQVHNLDASLSLNHNLINAYNVDTLLEMVESRLKDVEAELADVKDFCRDEDTFWDACQQVLFADCRMNVPKLIEFMRLILESRRGAEPHPTIQLAIGGNCWKEDPAHFKTCEKCFLKLKLALIERCTCQNPALATSVLCQSCSEFQRWFDHQRAKIVKERALTLSEAAPSGDDMIRPFAIRPRRNSPIRKLHFKNSIAFRPSEMV